MKQQRMKVNCLHIIAGIMMALAIFFMPVMKVAATGAGELPDRSIDGVLYNIEWFSDDQGTMNYNATVVNFENSDAITAITIPDTFMYDGDSQGHGAGTYKIVGFDSNGYFEDCTQLSAITILGNDVALSNTVFSFCENLKTVNVTTDEMKAKLEAHFAYNHDDIDNYPKNVTVVNINATTDEGTDNPTDENTDNPTDENTDNPTDENTDNPTEEDTDNPTEEYIDNPTEEYTDGSTEEDTTYLPPVWTPTTPDEIFNFSLKSSETPIYNIIEGDYPITLYSEVQGQLCIDAMKKIAGNRMLCQTYNILPNSEIVYKMDSPITMVLNIPMNFQKTGREFSMICVTEEGRTILLSDLDKADDTITFRTSDFYAYALSYIE